MHDNAPFIEMELKDGHCWSGWTDICLELNNTIAQFDKKKIVIVIECNHGTYEEVNFKALKKGLNPNASCKSSHIYREPTDLYDSISPLLYSENRQPSFTHITIEEYFDTSKKEALIRNITFIEEGIILIFGIGACLIWPADLLIYADMSQWEIQQRFKRDDIANIGLQNERESFEKQYEWAFFNDWQICNQIKRNLLDKCSYFLDTNNWAKPKLASGTIVRKGLEKAAHQPLKIAPFFDPELFESRHANKFNDSNLKWYYHCVPEEDNLLFQFGTELFEIPLLNLIFYLPDTFLGQMIVNKFGSCLPIRFNFIDTFDTRTPFYSLTPPGSIVEDSLGSKYPLSRTLYSLETTSSSTIELGSSKTLKSFPIQKHDFINIPKGIIFRPGEKIIALEISTASEIFTLKSKKRTFFKPWSTPTQDNQNDFLIQPRVKEESDQLLTEIFIHKTPSFQLEVVRHWFNDRIQYQSGSTVSILNLVEGKQAAVESPDGLFSPFTIRRGETIILPATIGLYQLTASNKEEKLATILARMSF